MKGRLELRVVFALAATVVIWASAFAGIRAGLEGYSAATWRCCGFWWLRGFWLHMQWSPGCRFLHGGISQRF